MVAGLAEIVKRRHDADYRFSVAAASTKLS
jgi:hypothetical protein